MKCGTCNVSKPTDEFIHRNGKPQGQCKICRNEYIRRYRNERASGERTKNEVQVVNNGKVCTKCNSWKPLTEYPTRKSIHGYRHECKECKKKILFEYGQNVYNEKRRTRKKEDANYRVLCNHRHYIYKCLTRYSRKCKSTVEYIGCDVDTLVKWLEYQFDEGMTWENYGKVWTIDHVIPLSKFDLTNEKNQKVAFNWSNMHPSKDNFCKGSTFRLWEYFNVLLSAHRFITHYAPSLGYQSLNESLNWLRNNSGMVTIP